MFCPVGYRPASELWAEFVALRLEGIYESVVRGYHEHDFQAAFTRGSPLDVCEHLFLMSLARIGIHLASPDGKVIRVKIRMEDGAPSLFSMTGIYGGKIWYAAAQTDGNKLNGAAFITNSRFRAWHAEPDDSQALAQQYPPSSELKVSVKRGLYWGMYHHTLHHHVHRNSYVVSDQVPDWAKKTAASVDVAPILKHYSGWAICVDEATYLEKWPDYLSGKIEIYGSDTDRNTVPRSGRPRLEAAFAAFEAMNFEKGKLSWEQVALRIERETGEKPSHKSLRNWQGEQGEE